MPVLCVPSAYTEVQVRNVSSGSNTDLLQVCPDEGYTNPCSVDCFTWKVHWYREPCLLGIVWKRH